MKKIALLIAAIVMTLTCVFVISACDQTPKESVVSQASEEDVVSQTPEEDVYSQEAEEKIESFIESDSFQEQIDSVKSQFESVFYMDIRAEDSSIVYEYTYKNQIPDSELDATKDYIESSIPTTASTFESMANAMKRELKISNPSVVLNYINADGTLITSAEFYATE